MGTESRLTGKLEELAGKALASAHADSLCITKSFSFVPKTHHTQFSLILFFLISKEVY